MYKAENEFTESLLKSIPLKVVSWIELLNELETVTVFEVAGIRVCIDNDAQIGAVKVLDTGSVVSWRGTFPSNMTNIEVSNELCANAIKHLSAVVDLEKEFYDRLQEFQDRKESAESQSMYEAAKQFVETRTNYD